MFHKKLPALLLLLFTLPGSRAVAHVQQTVDAANSAQPPNLSVVHVSPGDFASHDEVAESSSLAIGETRSIPVPSAAKEPRSMRPFRTFALGFKANTLGAGAEIATPLSRSLNLRAGVNLFAFAHPFRIDGIDYNAELHFRSSQVSLDWFPERSGFHVSPGLVYLQNNLSAVAGAPPGQYFELGDQGFTNSVDDPLNGVATVVYPRRIAPMLLLGFSNILPRNGKRLSMPYEFGVVYTGEARVDVKLNGTACTYEGCFDAAKDLETQKSLQQEIDKLNRSLKTFPVYPIVSLGLAYRF